MLVALYRSVRGVSLFDEVLAVGAPRCAHVRAVRGGTCCSWRTPIIRRNIGAVFPGVPVHVYRPVFRRLCLLRCVRLRGVRPGRVARLCISTSRESEGKKQHENREGSTHNRCLWVRKRTWAHCTTVRVRRVAGLGPHGRPSVVKSSGEREDRRKVYTS